MPSKTYRVPHNSFTTTTTSGTDIRDGSTYSSEVRVNDGIRVIELLERTWVNTPEFKAKRSKGLRLPTNPYYYNRTIIGPSPGTITSGPYKTGIGSETVSVVSGPYCVVGVSPSAFTIGDDELSSRLISQAKGHDWNAGIFAAELSKTSSMVVQRATHLAHMANTLRRGDLFGFFRMFHNSIRQPSNVTRRLTRFNSAYAVSPASAAGNAWLEYRYGWRPFMKDVQDAVNSMLDARDKPRFMTATVRAHKKVRTFNVNTKAVLLDADTYRIFGEIHEQIDEELRVSWNFSPSSLDMPARFGLVNPLEVAWELLPFSFVADWFLPIGGYLNAMDAPFRFDHRGGSVGHRSLVKATFLAKTISPASSRFTGFSGHGSHLSITRYGLLAPPTVDLSSLSAKFDLTAAQATSAIALLQQQLSRLKR